MTYLNFHTHHPEQEGEKAILQGRDSWGIHPWHATEEHLEAMPPHPISAIGECGLDRACNTPYPLQLRVFEKQIALSEAMQKPLIIHCVKAFDDLTRLHRKHRPTQAWTIHGFRGKPQLMHSLLKEGFYLSFGFLHNPQSLVLCPIHRLFLETDNTPSSIASLYEEAAQLRNTTPEVLSLQLFENLEKIHLHL